MLRSLSRLRRWFRAPILPEQYRCRPCLESLEDRLAPALNLTISTLVTNAGVTVTDFGNVRTFEATASGANVNVGDILYALDNEFDVVVSTGSMVIGEDGDLTWNFTPALIFNGPDGDLSLQTSTATGDITLNSQIHAVFYYNADLNLTLSGAGNITANHTLALDSLNATTTGGTITLNAPVGAISSLDLDASVAVNVNDDVDVDEGNIDLAAATVTLGALLLADQGSVTITGNLILTDNVLFYADDDVTFAGTINGAHYLTVATNNGFVTLAGVGNGTPLTSLIIEGVITMTGNITLTGGLFVEGSVITTGSLVIDLTGGSGQAIFVDGDFILGGDLDIDLASASSAVNLFGIDLDAGTFNLTTNGQLNVDSSTISGSGTVSAQDVDLFNGVLSPGGEGPAGATLTVVGSVTFNSGSALHIDLGATADVLVVNGTVNIDSDAQLEIDGALVTPGPFTILTATAILGAFDGTAGGVNFIIGTQVATAVYTSTTLAIQQAVPGPNTVTAANPGGAIYTVKLSSGGGAGLILVDDPDTLGIEGIFVQNATLANKLIITVQPNGGNPIVDLLLLEVTGSLRAITAPSINLSSFNNHFVTGYLKTATFHDVIGSLTLGGTANQKTTLKGRIFDGLLTMTSKLNLLSGNEFFTGNIDAPAIGKVIMKAGNGGNGDFFANLTLDAGSSAATAITSVNVAGDLGDADEWLLGFGQLGDVNQIRVSGGVFDSTIISGGRLGSVTAAAWVESIVSGAAIGTFTIVGGVFEGAIVSSGRISSIKAAEWVNADVTAASIGTIHITGNAAAGFSGDWDDSNLNLTGSANPGQVALKKFTVKGAVVDSTFHIQAGNVTSFVVGKFLSSNLYLGLPTGSLTSGNFTGNFKLGTFKTTALPSVPEVVDANTVAVVDSEVCASRFGIVRLSSVQIDNFDTLFGLRVSELANAAGSVRIATAPFTANQNILPGEIEDDFRFFAND